MHTTAAIAALQYEPELATEGCIAREREREQQHRGSAEKVNEACSHAFKHAQLFGLLLADHDMPQWGLFEATQYGVAVSNTVGTSCEQQWEVPAAVIDSKAALIAGSSLNCRHAVRRSLLSVSPSIRT